MLLSDSKICARREAVLKFMLLVVVAEEIQKSVFDTGSAISLTHCGLVETTFDPIIETRYCLVELSAGPSYTFEVIPLIVPYCDHHEGFIAVVESNNTI